MHRQLKRKRRLIETNYILLIEDSKKAWEFPGGLGIKGSNVVTAVMRVRSLTWERLHAACAATGTKNGGAKNRFTGQLRKGKGDLPLGVK